MFNNSELTLLKKSLNTRSEYLIEHINSSKECETIKNIYAKELKELLELEYKIDKLLEG